ncbi:MAG: hypothetical protein ABW185_28500 [Sedimenticola sp.]
MMKPANKVKQSNTAELVERRISTERNSYTPPLRLRRRAWRKQMRGWHGYVQQHARMGHCGLTTSSITSQLSASGKPMMA